MTGAAVGDLELVASMATPAVLLLGNAMLILSTNQRLQSILARLLELEGVVARARTGDGGDLERALDLVRRHARRARLAHRALLFLYLSGSVFIVLVLVIGASGVGLASGRAAVWTAVLGCLLLLFGLAQLARETWLGISATDEQFRSLIG